jgi:type IV secretion system protein VirB4
MVLATQSSDDIARSEIVQVAVENCPTKLFLANPDMKEEVYGPLFHLNTEEIRRIRQLRLKKQFLLKQPTHSKVLNLNVDPKSYWLFTTNPYEITRREEAFRKYGITRGLEELAKERHA